MTWKEFCEKAKEMGYSLSDEFLSNRYIMKSLISESVITFYENGEVKLSFETNFFKVESLICKKMEYDQMLAVMKALQ